MNTQHARIVEHPILSLRPAQEIPFTWRGQPLVALEGETLAAALLANGVQVFGHHLKDGAPQGLYCANGQCAQCMVLADGRPVKACMTLVHAGVRVEPLDALPALPASPGAYQPVTEIAVPVLILGGGPAGLSAAIELGRRGIQTLLIDDRHRLGGKLVLQTHRFFGSADAVYAGTRGIDIARKLEEQVRALPSVQIWLNSVALAVFSDRVVGILTAAGMPAADGAGADLDDGSRYALVRPEVLLVATGARERSLVFKGNTLPGVYGAGAFQTLVNRDRVRISDRLFIVGGGNVGLIAGYHALQAGIFVVGLAEAMPECSGYKVHQDKLARLGVPIYPSHTILSADGSERVESVTIARVDNRFRPLPGTERSFPCDTVLIAVGLDPVDEFYYKARAFGMPAFAAGDAAEIAEASVAIFDGRIKALDVARALGHDVAPTPLEWSRAVELLKSKPGRTEAERLPEAREGVLPVLHCTQEIPCDPCAAACPQGLIHIDREDLRQVPVYRVTEPDRACSGCARCVVACPGLAITLVDYRQDPEQPTVTVPYEFLQAGIHVGDGIEVTDTEGQVLGECEVTGVRAPAGGSTTLVEVRAPAAYAAQIAGLRPQGIPVPAAGEPIAERTDDEAIVCRCERVTAGEIRALIRAGVRDINEIKALTRAGMGACGGKTCVPLIQRLYREEGVPDGEGSPEGSPRRVVDHVGRPLFVEAPLGAFAQGTG